MRFLVAIGNEVCPGVELYNQVALGTFAPNPHEVSFAWGFKIFKVEQPEAVLCFQISVVDEVGPFVEFGNSPASHITLPDPDIFVLCGKNFIFNVLMKL